MLGITVTSLACYVALTNAWSTFVVPHTDNEDDTPALMAAVSDYASDSTIVFQAYTTYNIWSPITFPELRNVEVVIEGNLSYPTSIKRVQGYVASSNYSGAWFAFTGGSNVTLRGSTDPNWGWVDGHGQQWWDAKEQVNRPDGWLFGRIDTGVIKNMKIYKVANWREFRNNNRKIYISTTILSWLCLTALDGFSASGTNLLFEYNYVVNGDDCLAVVNGAENVTWRNGYCESSHGLSVGSLGKNGQVSSVKNVLFENTIMNHTLYAARFESWTGGNGVATNVTWRNIAFIDVMFPIYVTQNYWDQDIGPRPNTSSVNETHIENFTFENFVGVINDTPDYVEGTCVSDPCWYSVPGATGKEVAIFDLYPGTATNIVTQNLFARTLTGTPDAVMCNASTITNDVGFVCWNGPYIPTQVGL